MTWYRGFIKEIDMAVIGGTDMQIKLDNSDLILLLPKDYSRVWNGEEL